MNKIIIFFIVVLLCGGSVNAQLTGPLSATDSISSTFQPITDEAGFLPDSFAKRPLQGPIAFSISEEEITSPYFKWKVLESHPYFGFGAMVTTQLVADGEVRKVVGKEWLFYLIVFLLLVFALIRQVFSKYLNDLFRVFFRTTLNQRQISEQMMQAPIASFLLNVFFVVVASLYCTFLIEKYNSNPVGNFWLLFFYCACGFAAIYLIKFIGLKISGWLFSMKEAADTYIFIVFVINKMIGIFLVPFLILIAFTSGSIYSISLTLSWCMIGMILLYRMILTFAAIRNQVSINPFHFFLYLLAFEIAPLLLVYKGLLVFLGITS